MTSPTPTWIILGLGNPGRGNVLDRCNVGEMAIDAMAAGASFQRRGIAQICHQELGVTSVILAKLQVYMNRSGQPAQELLTSFGVPPGQLCVVHDDPDMELGSLRIRTRGAPSAHVGMSSITRALATFEVPRLRIGTGLPPLASARKDFTDDDIRRLELIFRGVAKALEILVAGHAEKAMSLYNRRDTPIDRVPGLTKASILGMMAAPPSPLTPRS